MGKKKTAWVVQKDAPAGPARRVLDLPPQAQSFLPHQKGASPRTVVPSSSRERSQASAEPANGPAHVSASRKPSPAIHSCLENRKLKITVALDEFCASRNRDRRRTNPNYQIHDDRREPRNHVAAPPAPNPPVSAPIDPAAVRPRFWRCKSPPAHVDVPLRALLTPWRRARGASFS